MEFKDVEIDASLNQRMLGCVCMRIYVGARQKWSVSILVSICHKDLACILAIWEFNTNHACMYDWWNQYNRSGHHYNCYQIRAALLDVLQISSLLLTLTYDPKINLQQLHTSAIYRPQLTEWWSWFTGETCLVTSLTVFTKSQTWNLIITEQSVQPI